LEVGSELETAAGWGHAWRWPLCIKGLTISGDVDGAWTAENRRRHRRRGCDLVRSSGGTCREGGKSKLPTTAGLQVTGGCSGLFLFVRGGGSDRLWGGTGATAQRLVTDVGSLRGHQLRDNNVQQSRARLPAGSVAWNFAATPLTDVKATAAPMQQFLQPFAARSINREPVSRVSLTAGSRSVAQAPQKRISAESSGTNAYAYAVWYDTACAAARRVAEVLGRELLQWIEYSTLQRRVQARIA